MSNFYKWILRKYLTITKVRKDETIIVAFKEEFDRKELEAISESLVDMLGDKVVLIGGVDKIIVV